MTDDLPVPPGWLPVGLDRATGELAWRATGPNPATRFGRAMAPDGRDDVRTVVTPDLVSRLEAAAIPLAGLILHLSRSGSTLVAASLATRPRTRVLDEPDLLDQALTAVRCGEDPDLLWLRAVLAALGRPGGGAERYLLKTDSWHALALEPLLRVRPTVPWLFVYRDPVEVLASHRRQPGAQTVPGLLPDAWFGPVDGMHPTEYAVRILGAICAAIVPHAQPSTVLNYVELPEALTARVPLHFGLDRLEPQALATVTARHAKRPYEAFLPDSEAKRAAVGGELRALLDRWVTPHYRALESVRHDAST